MITKNEIKQIKSLSRKKNREQLQLFVVEGYKSIRELQEIGLELVKIYCLRDATELQDLEPIIISHKDMCAISNLKTPPGYLALSKMPINEDIPSGGRMIALDAVQDPGNLGTIVRMADWFGVEHIICSLNTVDLYNPKCIQATMASIGRVQVHYINLKEFLSKTSIPILIAAMDGNSIYKTQLPTDGILVMGNESHGVSEDILEMGDVVSIPRYGVQDNPIESLNVATATAILLSEWCRATGT